MFRRQGRMVGSRRETGLGREEGKPRNVRGNEEMGRRVRVLDAEGVLIPVSLKLKWSPPDRRAVWVEL